MAETTALVELGGAFLPATVESLLHKLASSDFIHYLKYSHMNILKLTVFETKLLTLHSVLLDADHKQFFNPKIKKWMNKLYDTVSDAEDLIDEIGYDSLRCKVQNTQPRLGFMFDFKLKMICDRLQRFVQQIDTLGLQSVSVRVSLDKTLSSSMVNVNDSVIVGRKDDKERLINMLLLNDVSSSSNLGVIAILGVGGVGKSTLARLVYDDRQVDQHFDVKVFVRVLEGFDILEVTKALYNSMSKSTKSTYVGKDLNHLRLRFKDELLCKRFLFVLDDLRIDSYNDWHHLITPLFNGNCGSRVIVTTRYEKVAEVVRTYPVLKLGPLSEEDCWSLLSKHAFGSCGNKFPELEAIGRKIARKCGGFPIAAKSLGGLLSSKVDANVWTAILNSDIWNITNDCVMLSLLLTYQHLPSQLKRCFSYCSIFPKGYLFNRKKLVLLWMAEGFLEDSVVEKAPEDVGDDYFDEMLSRSLFEPSNDDIDDSSGEKFIMHDLIYDLATIASGKSCCRFESGGTISDDVHHLSYYQEEYDIFKKFEMFFDFKCLRSFLPIGSSKWQESYLSHYVIDYMIPSIRRLRVLSLSNYKSITVLPNSINNLVQLRYLDLSYTKIKCLPDTTCDLYYLQTLTLLGCMNLIELPVHIGNLINLRHLDISYTRVKEMPEQVVGLENLQTLTVFLVAKQEIGLSVRELGKFPNLRGKLCIVNMHNGIDVSEVCDANLKNKEYLEELKVYWDGQTEDSPTPTEKAILNELQPSINLKKLSIGFYGGTSFPSWLGDCSFSNMVYLCINTCKHCITLPPLGQLPSLKELEINDMSRVETIGLEFYGMTGVSTSSPFQPFPLLEKLQFDSMPNWKEWLSFGGRNFPFPRLKTLRLSGCAKLRGHLPSHLPSIEEVTVHWCNLLWTTLSTLHWLSSVKSLDLRSRGSTELSLLGNDSPCLLQAVTIFGFIKLLSLPKMFSSSTCLQHLHLIYISSLTAFPANGLPTSLQSLHIDECQNLAFLPPETWSNYTSLVTLYLKNCCDSLTSFQLNGFPVLQTLSIEGCSSLESIFISENASLGLSTLQSLQVKNCDALRSLPQRMDTLIALGSLTLNNLSLCCEVACLPPKLQFMHIESLRTTTPVSEWGFQNLYTLYDLHIGGDNIVNTLLKEHLLPNFLVSLTITNLSEMKCLEGNGLQHISSLKNLTFKCCAKLESYRGLFPSFLKSLVFANCPKLKSLPDRLPSSLETLEFDECLRLGLLPRHGFPDSLKVLGISRCPLLKARYATKRKDHLSKIAHIPVTKIDHEVTI
ncbi:putative disease resistance RPP13-like protein 1 [Vicia villosa]|uniref:putative disease resistance RPP13-like protein 1 n=1 Tax=Vicia villosa TaxID=3911 RepID=UPI00273CEDAA|nr:putative disease resistance RPP13-like protein 1 [Vicia villosa]